MDFSKQLQVINEKGFFDHLKIFRGIEKEALRVNKSGELSKLPHPDGLGSPLTNCFITTDFSESLIELVTPKFDDVKALMSFLKDLHVFSVKTFDENEVLWGNSMPCRLTEEEIPIAQYGRSNIGRLKHIYRKGLKVRYGATMQCVAGIHYNFSLADSTLAFLIPDFTQDEKSDLYLDLIRNFKRNFWFILRIMGSSPMIDKTFVEKRDHGLSQIYMNSLYEENATSLRMSNIGYQSAVQSNLNIKYNSLTEFIDALGIGISEGFKPFQELGLYDKNNERQQISDGILQIENELYDSIRPKRKGASGLRPIELLRKNGIEYVEIRGIDLSPSHPLGISEEDIICLDIFLLHCLLYPSKKIDDKEQKILTENYNKVIHNGADGDQEIIFRDSKIKISEAENLIVEELCSIADLMGDNSKSILLSKVQTGSPSKSFLNTIMQTNKTFVDYVLSESIESTNLLRNEEIEQITLLNNERDKSKEQLQKLESQKTIDLEEYVKQYNLQIVE